jgi:N-methylhydantoinase A
VWTVDVDVGGTLTDAVFTDGNTIVCVKVDTTPHDLTMCLLDCLGQGAAKLGFDDPAEFGDQIEVIRWSTTITSNVLAERRGPRLGLLVSRGHERDLYGSTPRSVVLDSFLSDTDVIGINGSSGETEIMGAARSLLERGVRRICVSLTTGDSGAEAEYSVKRTIDRHYPDHFLGSVPILAGSDIASGADDQTRTYCALINAYTHGALAATLFKAEDELRDNLRFAGSFLVSHINGGAAGVAKTRAIDTIESGPVLGIQGSAFLATAYGLKEIIALDIGGTTAKVSLLAAGQAVYRKPSDFFGIPVGISLPDLHSIALGGGSVIRTVKGQKDQSIELGPDSMGSYPGPACYGLGGDQATLTDAFVTAGLINPEYFLGGAKPIDRELASQSIKEQIADQLGISTDEACTAVITRAFAMVADMIARSAAGRDLSGHTLFAYGGNGGLFACGVADLAGVDSAYIFSLGPVFSAFGSSVSDICHVYERPLGDLTISAQGATMLSRILGEIKAEAVKDLLGEGVKPDHVIYSIVLEVSVDGAGVVSVACPESALSNPKELDAVIRSGLGLDPAPGEGAASMKLIRVGVTKAMRKLELSQRPLEGADSSHAFLGTRPVLWGGTGSNARVYRWESLRPGNRIEGRALLEGESTTYFIPDGWVALIDTYGNGQLSRIAKNA